MTSLSSSYPKTRHTTLYKFLTYINYIIVPTTPHVRKCCEPTMKDAFYDRGRLLGAMKFDNVDFNRGRQFIDLKFA